MLTLLFLLATLSADTTPKKWLEEEVSLIATREERESIETIQTSDEFDQFVEDFWKKRDPTQDTDENEFKAEHYRRLSYADQHFGRTTERGKSYILFGPPEKLETLEAGEIERWSYSWLFGIGADIVLNFRRSRDYELEFSPEERCVLFCTDLACVPIRSKTLQCILVPKGSVWNDAFSSLFTGIGWKSTESTQLIYGRVFDKDRRTVTTFEDIAAQSNGPSIYRKDLRLPPGEYEAQIVVKEDEERLDTVRFTVSNAPAFR